MISHYLKSALRNLRKYRTQNVISVLSIGVSVTLFAAVTSLLLTIKVDPLLYQPYANRSGAIEVKKGGLSFDESDVFAIDWGHQFKSIEKFYPRDLSFFVAMAARIDEEARGADVITTYRSSMPDFMQWNGYRSAITGKIVGCLSENEVFITESYAIKMFGSVREAVGKPLEFTIFMNSPREAGFHTFFVADVICQPGMYDSFFSNRVEAVISYKETATLFFIDANYTLREGHTRDDAKNELLELFGNHKNAEYLAVESCREYFSSSLKWLLLSRGIILFLFIFIMVSVTSWIRQQVLLFRLRQREVALRTASGGKPRQLFWLFFTEIAIILAICMCLTLILNPIIRKHILLELTEIKFTTWIDGSLAGITLTAYSIIFVLCILTAYIAARAMSRKNKALALQMRPSNVIRNTGLAIQLTISIVFTSIIAAFLFGTKNLTDYLNVPTDDSEMKRAISVLLNVTTKGEQEIVYDKLVHSENIEKLCPENFNGLRLSLPSGKELDIWAYYQIENETVDFYGIHVVTSPSKAKYHRNVLIDKQLQAALIDDGSWDTGTLTMNNVTYDLAGVYESFPYRNDSQLSCIITDPIEDEYYKMNLNILPRKGREREFLREISDVLNEVFPDRNDIAPRSLYKRIASEWIMFKLLIMIIYILAGISLTTTIAGIYSAVSLDTRRRRKEMALRKVNGAKTKDIRRIFARIYVIILAVSIVAAIPPSIIAIRWTSDYFKIGMSPWMPFIAAVLMIIAVTIITIAQKIRDVMRVDPAEYTKY